MAEADYLYVAVGFLGTLFIMKSIRALRPPSASAMAQLGDILGNQSINYQPYKLVKTGCSKCGGK